MCVSVGETARHTSSDTDIPTTLFVDHNKPIFSQSLIFSNLFSASIWDTCSLIYTVSCVTFSFNFQYCTPKNGMVLSYSIPRSKDPLFVLFVIPRASDFTLPFTVVHYSQASLRSNQRHNHFRALTPTPSISLFS